MCATRETFQLFKSDPGISLDLVDLTSHILNMGFHPIPLGVSEKEGKEKKKKKGKREKLWKIKHILFALLNSSYAVIQ